MIIIFSLNDFRIIAQKPAPKVVAVPTKKAPAKNGTLTPAKKAKPAPSSSSSEESDDDSSDEDEVLRLTI